MTPPVALSVAGSDSSGGAGIQADLKTFAALGVLGTSAVTAVTAQGTTSVRAVHPLPVEVVRAQLEAVLDDLPVAATKTGMLATPAIVELVAELAGAGRLPALVVDPVMVSSGGTRLLDAGAERLYLDRLLPVAAVFTPNLAEAGALLGSEVLTACDQREAAAELARRTTGAVVVTGGDAGADAVDVVCAGGRLHELRAPRVATANDHGTGCSFASAIAAGLARGLDTPDALARAKHHVTRALSGAARWDLGAGRGPLDHFHWEAVQ